ncbi:hypothetical protein OBBRIDRAFT_729817 [Obba rivulosa]|uniref:Uncharacterized protein n=1 Tax=Obba rivulosa TaxID=1052685 RepID=A0A8E2B3U1_9APHY|nr:hypothetical protein OBBRIDRAFT_729817 [Obba rivulosa]
MSYFAVFFALLCALVCSVLGTPVPENANMLEKRITHTGRGTWFDVGLGACGYTNVNSDKIVAISADIYGDGGNCNQYVQVTNTANGKSAWGQTRDKCPGCGAYDLDMSPSLFEELGSLDTGVLEIEWHFENKAWHP